MSLTLSAILLMAAPVAQKAPGPFAQPPESVTDKSYFIASAPVQYAQVRIQKRIIIRVPRRRMANTNSLSDITRNSAPVTYKEKKIGKCLPMNNILGVQVSGDRYLDLITKDRRRIRAQLGKKCQARSFYSGFYMEKSGDGRMCADRDILHSRTGSKCEIERFRLLVAK